MKFNQSILEVIKQRTSIRTFDKQPISKEHEALIKNYLSNNLVGPFGQSFKIQYIPITKNHTDKGIKIGTYGFIKSPQAYLVGVMEDSDTNTIEFGYLFEKLVLLLTDLGIGTCWLGGTFTRESFETEINLSKNEMIPAITPIGYPADKKRLFEKTLRSFVKADNKKSFENLFFKHNFDQDLTREDSGEFEMPLEMVRLGPSASNKQPWRVILSEDQKTCHFFLKKTSNYSGNREGFTMQRLDLGIAMCHFELTCQELGLKGKWVQTQPNIPLNDQMEYHYSWQLLE
jgi:nitroreductase